MPLYFFQNQQTEEIREVFFHMNDVKEYFGDPEDNDAAEWKRIYTVPMASIDTEIDPFDKNAYMRKTENKNTTLGEMWDKSAEMSRKRAERTGKDPVKEKFLDNYKKERNGISYDKVKRTQI